MYLENGKVICIGSLSYVESCFSSNTVEKVDLKGKTVLPGIHDVHQHPLEVGNEAGGQCMLKAHWSLERAGKSVNHR